MARSARPKPTELELRSWFDDQMPLGRLLLGLRAIGFSADAIADVVGAPGRETVYAWAAGRSQPTRWNAEQLDRLRLIVSSICNQAGLGPESVWLVLNGWPGGLDPSGPNGLALLANKESEDDWLKLSAALGSPVAVEPHSSKLPDQDDHRRAPQDAPEPRRRREHA